MKEKTSRDSSEVVKEVESKVKGSEAKRVAVEAARVSIEKRYGKGALMRFDDEALKDIEVIPSGSIEVDEVLGVWGYPRGRIIEVFGPESCLDGDVFIQYEIRTKDGGRQNHKGGTIRRLYERFHGIDRGGKGFYQRDVSRNSRFSVPSVNESNCVFRNSVMDVVFSGRKQCFLVRSISGKEIVCTEDHRFFVGTGYVRLGDLSVGSTVFVHDNVPVTGRKDPNRYLEVFVRFHPNGRRKVVTANDKNGNKRYSYVRYRVPKSHLLVEADRNKMTYDEYMSVLNSGDMERIDSMWVVPDGMCVHHKDENPRNDVLDNLELMDGPDHNRGHAKENHNKLRFVIVEDRIESVVPVGYRETYDIKCLAPFNNFVAGGFVVHNSGKTTMALHAVAEAQKLGGIAAFIDAEHALDPQYAQVLGVNMKELWLSQPGAGEEALEIVDALTRSGGVDIIVVDSVAALTPQAEIDGDMGDSHMGLQARLMSQALRKLSGVISRTSTVLMFVNQMRTKIGMQWGNPETTPGGVALKFWATIRLEVRKIESITKDNVVISNLVRVKAVKNKVAPPFRKAEIEIVFGQGVNRMKSILASAVAREIIQKSGSWYSFGEERIGQGMDAAVAFLKEHARIAEEIEKTIRNGKEKRNAEEGK